jgi:hypothetical protein
MNIIYLFIQSFAYISNNLVTVGLEMDAFCVWIHVRTLRLLATACFCITCVNNKQIIHVISESIKPPLSLSSMVWSLTTFHFWDLIYSNTEVSRMNTNRVGMFCCVLQWNTSPGSAPTVGFRWQVYGSSVSTTWPALLIRSSIMHGLHLEDLEINCLLIGPDYNLHMHTFTWK